jgi:dimethylglycine dehydrogenase
MRSQARVVVVGGGCVGASVLYALARQGCTDTVLLERTQLTAGSTWHAAGLLVLYTHSYSASRVIQKSIEIYGGLEQDTGQAIGLHQCGQLRVAHSADQMDEFTHYMDMAETIGVRARLVSPAEIREIWPLLEGDRAMIGGLHHLDDGHVAPADVTQALAKGARDRGAEIRLDTPVLGFERVAGGLWRVRTAKGDITCEHVVIATGNYARETGAMVGLQLPAIPIVHQYWVTEPVPEIRQRRAAGRPELPVLRVEPIHGYIREEGEGLMFGPYENADRLELFAADGVPAWFGADLLPEDFAAVEENWAAASELLPVFQRVGIRRNVRGPFQMTSDIFPLVGPAPGLTNFWLAEGVPGGIVWGGGLGHHLAEWILQGQPSIDLSEVDARRFGGHATKSWTGIKVREAWGNHSYVHFPGQEWPLARPARTAPSYDRLTRAGAVWGVLNGWEVPNWFAPEGVEPKDDYSFRRTRCAAWTGEEARAVRSGVGLVEMSMMGKLEVEGPGAAAWLDRILANRLPKPGRIALCHLLTERGGVLSELVVSRPADDLFYLVVSPRAERHDFDVLSRLLPADGTVRLRNATMERGGFAVVGPRARELLQPLVEADLGNQAFPWLSVRSAPMGFSPDVRLLRVNYEGELGWELYHPIADQLHLLEEIRRRGEALGLRLVGIRALESLRLDKSYRAIYRDINVEHSALESGLERFVRLDKGEFIGRAALAREAEAGPARRLATVMVEPGQGDLIRNEAVHHEGRLVGRVSSGSYSYHFERNIGLAYVPPELAVPGTPLEIPILGQRRAARVVADSPYDPENARPRM